MIEIARSIAEEIERSFFAEWTTAASRRLRRIVLCWCAPISLGILAWLFVRQIGPADPGLSSAAAAATASPLSQELSAEPVQKSKPRLLLAILTPVNLFTGVLACGLVCLLVIWMDHRWLPYALRPRMWLTVMNGVSAVIFLWLEQKVTGIMKIESSQSPV